MHSKIIEQLKEEERKAFLKLNPVARVLRMEKLLHEVISIKAKEQGVSEGEIYQRYIERDKKRRRGV